MSAAAKAGAALRAVRGLCFESDGIGYERASHNKRRLDGAIDAALAVIEPAASSAPPDFGPTAEVKKRWRDDALRANRVVALDQPPLDQAGYALWIASLAAYVLCLTTDVAATGETDRYWDLTDTPRPAAMRRPPLADLAAALTACETLAKAEAEEGPWPDDACRLAADVMRLVRLTRSALAVGTGGP